MKSTTVVLLEVLENVAPRFVKANYRKRKVNRIFPSVKAMNKAGYKSDLTHYTIVDENDNVIREVNNANINGFGTRYTR